MGKKVTKPILADKPNRSDTIGKKIDYIRRDRGLTQEQLAKKLKVTKKTIIEYEKAKDKIPLQKLKQISIALNVPTDYLLGLSDVDNYDISNNGIHKETRLSPKAIRVLKEIKNNKKQMEIINFLIEQEEPCPTGFTPIVKKKMTQEEYTQAFEKAQQAYEEDLEKWEKTHIPIISTICGFFTAKAKNEELYVINDSIKNEKDLEHKIDKFLATKIMSNDKLVDNAYLSEINNYLRKAKQRFLRKEGNKN